MSISYIKSCIQESISTKKALLEDEQTLTQILNATNAIVKAYKENKKVLIFGNGGSASDAQHIAGELVGRFRFDRKPLDARALNVDGSLLTCISNDYSFEDIFSRQIAAHAKSGDIVIGLSTSGNSKNVYNGLKKALELGGVTISLLGSKGGICKDVSEYPIIIKSNDTPRIQEAHGLIAHVICDIVESSMFQRID